MKRKHGAVKRKPKKTAVAADIVEDPPLDPDVNEDNDGLDSRMEILAREASSRMSSGRLGLDKPVVHNETAGSAAAKLARVIDSSRSKASSDRVAVQHERISEKGTKSSQQAPACNKQELDDALSVIQKIMKMNGAMPFNSPVDPIALGIPDYFDIIDVPMDFGTICSNLEKGLEYKNSEDVLKDVQRIWDNCSKYNKKGSYILELMKRVKNNFMKQWTAAGLYNNEQQTVSNGHLPHNPELYADSTIRHEEAMHPYPVGSTVSSCAYLHRNDFSYLNKMQHQPFSPCCGSTFKPHHTSYQCPCSLHPAPLHHGHHHQDLAPQYNHHMHLHAVDHMNDHSCNQWANKASPNAMPSYQPPPSCCVIGNPQQRTCLHQSSSSHPPPAQLQTGMNAQSAGRSTGDKKHQQHQMDSVNVQAYQPSANCMPEHQFNQNTSPQLYSSRTEGGRNIPFAGRSAVDKDSVNVQAYQPSTNCMPEHQFNQNTSPQLYSSRTEGRNAGKKNQQQHQMDAVRVQAYQPSENCMPEHQFNQNIPQKLHSSRTEDDRNIGFAGNFDVRPPTESAMNYPKTHTGCSRPQSTDSTSCQEPDQINSTPEQSAPMINIETCHVLQPEISPSERTHSTSYNNFSKRETQGQGLAHCQEESSFMKNIQESEPEKDTFRQTSFLQSQLSPPTADSNMKSKRKTKRRGPRSLKFREGERISVATNQRGQPVGPEARKFISFLGTLARNGYFLPLTYHDWRTVPEEYKENAWREVQLRFDIDPISKESAMHSLGHAWKNWKCLLKTDRYYPHKTDQERLADRDERVPPDQWAALIALWSTEAVQERSAKIRARWQQKINQVTGNPSAARISEEQRQLHVGAKDKSTPQESNKNGRAYVTALGLSTKPTNTEATKTVSEANAEIHDMKQKMTVMEQTCAQMASQMAAMMSMMSSMHRGAPNKNVPDMIANTSGASDRSLPQLAPTVPSPSASSNC